MFICPPQNQKERKIRTEPMGSVVISTLVTPLYGPGHTPLPVLHSATRKDGKGGSIGTNEPHALGLDNSVDYDRIPDSGRSGLGQEKDSRKDEPSTIFCGCVGMVQSVPTLGLDQVPPGLVSLVAGHDDMIDFHVRVLKRQLLPDLPDAAGDDRDRSETFLEGDSIAPAAEVATSHVNGNVLPTSIRDVFLWMKYIQ